MLTQVHRAARRLLRSPAFAGAAVATLALSIAATTSVFSLVYGVLLQPLPFPQAERLVDLSHTLVLTGVTRVDQSDASFLYYRNSARLFSRVAAYQATAVNASSARGGADHAERVSAARISAGAFGVLDVAPLRGRAFTDREDRPGQARVALIGERFWRRGYAADPGIIGRDIDIDGVRHEIVGIMPARFRFPDAGTDLYLPLALDPSRTESATFDLRAVARLRDGVTPGAAEADLQRLLPGLPEAFPGRLTLPAIEATHMKAMVRPLRDVVVGEVGSVLWVLLGAVGCVLLIACANVTNLFLVRAEERQHELAVRRALGGGTAAIVAEFLFEGALLAGAGGVLGLALAASAEGVLRSLASTMAMPRVAEVGLHAPVLVATAAATTLAALIISLVPALRAGRGALAELLAHSARATSGTGSHRARGALVAAQVALALVLVTGAGLMARSFTRLRAVQPGFDADAAWTFRLALPEAAFPAAADVAAFVDRTLAGLSALPGVDAVAAVTKLPLDDQARRDTALFVEDRPLAPRQMPNIHLVNYATPGYFRALGIPLVQGRTFAPVDARRVGLEVIVSRAVAMRYWPGADAVGKRVRLSPRGPWHTVIGVTGDVRGTRLEQPVDEMVYLPLVTAPGLARADGSAGDARFAPRQLAIVLRSTSGAEAVAAAAQRVVRELAGSIPVYDAQPMTALTTRAAAHTSFTLLLLAVASGAALTIGAVGIYGVMAYLVRLRERELAVRLALGARPADVLRLVSRQAGAFLAAGIALGLVAAVTVTRFVTALLFGVAPTDPLTLAGAVAVLSVVGMVATWLPARRAALLDPARALRAE